MVNHRKILYVINSPVLSSKNRALFPEISEKLKGRSEVIMGIRPEDIDIGGKIKGSVELTEPLGLFSVIHVKIREDEIRVVTNSSSSYVKGDTIQLAISGNKALFFDESTGELIT
ncbi:TOBE domain-containing protein [Sulfolobus acidocaldarius]|nr:TOBE domain-containing protein [Sulfolobus acidocaldarius]